MKKLIALLLAVVMVLALAACGKKDNAAENKEDPKKDDRPVLTVGTSGDYPPFEFYTVEDGETKLTGADMKLAEYIADKLGMKLELVDMSFDALLGSLDEGKIDLVISGMTIDPERKCLYSDEYYSVGQSLLVPAGHENDFASMDDLMGKKIGGQMGAVQEELANQYAGDGAQIVNNVQDMIMMVSEGKLDGMFCENVVAEAAAAKSDKVAIANLEIPAEEANLVGACAKVGNTELINKINPIIAEVTEKNLYGEWMTGFLDMKDAGKPEGAE